MFSVVIPALNEEGYIVRALQSIPNDIEPVEVIVVDGGSVDATRELAASHARVVESSRGRAVQMNTGAACASGDVLVFLHADTQLPEDAFALVRAALSDASIEAGVFRLRFDADSALLRLYSLCTRLPLPQICFGDRSLFVRRSVFEEIGGFPDMPVFEDLEMVRMLHRRAGFRFLPQSVTTSARRFFQHGPFRQQLRNTLMWCRFMSGGDPNEVARYYSYDASH